MSIVFSAKRVIIEGDPRITHLTNMATETETPYNNS